ncbi:MAG: rRNA maturation RNase YbeY [Rickettsiales bacterium]|jgi:probable rRNA maturation factor|nr:rRNA maturation RNase YbeY [Rickettsiales bacterium]
MIHFIYEDKRWDRRLEPLAERAYVAAGMDGEVSLLLAGDVLVAKYNLEYRGKDCATNVLSFETGDRELPGDIILSYDTLSREAMEQGVAFEAHFAHLLLHGLLHLMGHDHQVEAEAEKMEAKEIEILEKLGFGNPYI